MKRPFRSVKVAAEGLLKTLEVGGELEKEGIISRRGGKLDADGKSVAGYAVGDRDRRRTPHVEGPCVAQQDEFAGAKCLRVGHDFGEAGSGDRGRGCYYDLDLRVRKQVGDACTGLP